MRTTVYFKDGHSETYDDVAPNVYEGTLSLLDSECGVIGDDVPLNLIQRIVFDNDPDE